MITIDENDQRRANARLAAVFEALSGDHPGADLREDDVLRRWAGIRFPFLNVVLVSPATPDPAAMAGCLRRAADYMRGRSEPGMAFICQAWLDRLAADERARVTDAAGLVRGGIWMEMIGDASAIAAADHPDLRFARMVDEDGVRIFADLNSEAYGFPVAAGREGILGSRDLWLSASSFIAYRGDEPVSVCSYLPLAGSLYLSWVATRPDARRRGYASALVGHALRQARSATGLEPTDLHATEDGAPVYERLGYRRGVPFVIFTLARD